MVNWWTLGFGRTFIRLRGSSSRDMVQMSSTAFYVKWWLAATPIYGKVDSLGAICTLLEARRHIKSSLRMADFTVSAFALDRDTIFDERSEEDMDPLFSQIRTFKWHGDGRQFTSDQRGKYSQVRAFRYLLHMMRLLEELDVRPHYRHSPEYWHPVLDHENHQGWMSKHSCMLTFPTLKRLTLVGVIHSFRGWARFLNNFKSSLVELKMYDCKIYDGHPGYWARVLRWMLNSLNLEYLRLVGLTGQYFFASEDLPYKWYPSWEQQSNVGSEDMSISIYSAPSAGLRFVGKSAINEGILSELGGLLHPDKWEGW